MKPIVSLRNVTKAFGGLTAVDDLTCELSEGLVTALIGPNGAGKSTVINLITCVYLPTFGQLKLVDADISGLPMHTRSRMGVARTYQTPQMIHGLSSIENVMAGAYRFGNHGLLKTIFAPWLVARENAEIAERAAAALRTSGVPEQWWERRATELPYGIQRRVEIARALAQEPKILLLDEPAAGLNPAETADIGRLLWEIARGGISVLLVEHDMPLVMSTADYVIVLNFGRCLATGTPSEIAANSEVVAAYLGTDEAEEELEGVVG
jgi:ABC-type branched-subunit amino acid transport system ATPase component